MNRLKNIVKYRAYIPTEYYVRDEKKAVYIPIPKVACTSLKEAFFEIDSLGDGYEDYMDVHRRLASDALHHLDAVQKEFFKFAFVRNPFDRLVSCYKDKVKKESQHNGRYYFDTRYERWILRTFSGIAFEPSMSFRQFVVAVSRVPDVFADGHFRSQYHYLYNKKKCAPDYVGKFEYIERDWEPVRQRFGLRAPPRRNVTEAIDFCNWYDSVDLVERVRERYIDDVEQWYQSEYETLKLVAAGNQ